MMNRFSRNLAYLAFAILGIALAYNTNISPIGEVRASPTPESVRIIKMSPNPDMDLLAIDRTTNEDLPVSHIEVTINHPKQVIEKEVKTIAYETKTEYLVKVVLFKLEEPAIHVPSISRIDKFEFSGSKQL